MEEALARYQKRAPQATAPTIDFDMQVFISTGIPEGALRELFRQAWEEPAGRVRFVLRGFEPQRLGELIGTLRGMFPEPKAEHIVIEIDPNAFRAYQVEVVPVYLVKEDAQTQEERWFEVDGMISLEGARENVRRRGPLVIGELYPIAEPDILAVIEARARDYDWSAALARAQARAAKNLSPMFDLPTVTQDAESFFTPLFTVPHDIVIPAHEAEPEHVLARAGQQFNVLDYTRLQVPIIVFDASDPRQRHLVKSWTQDAYKHADLFYVGAVEPMDGEPAQVVLAKALKRPVYPWFGRMTDRFGVRAVPAIVEQEGKQLRIRYVRPNDR